MRLTIPPRPRFRLIPPRRDPLERRLARERPRPDPAFAQVTGRQLGIDWGRSSRPPGFRLLLVACFAASVAVLLVAIAVALS
jgi:hypothetical protein